MFRKLGNYEIHKEKDCTIVIYQKENKYSFYVQKRNVTWHPMKSWRKIKECKSHSINYVKNLN